MKSIKRRIISIILIIFGACCVIGSSCYFFSNIYNSNSKLFYREFTTDDNALRIYFISETNVNTEAASGDSILLEKRDSSGKYHYGLIDTGNPGYYIDGLDDKIKAFLTEHMQGKAETVKSYNGSTGKVSDKYVLDFLLITHNDVDHIGNAASIVDDFKFKSVYLKDIKYEVYLSKDKINYTSAVLYGSLVSKILDQNHHSTEPFKTIIYGLDDFSKYDDSKDFCTLDKVSGTDKNKVDDLSSNAFVKTPDICRLLVYYASSSDYYSGNNVSFWLEKMRGAEKGVDYIPLSEMSSRSIDFGGATIDLFNLTDNELVTEKYLSKEKYAKYKAECPYYPYWPDYYDKTGNTLHGSEINDNYSSDSDERFKHYSNYYAKYDVYDPETGKYPTHSGTTQINENVRSIAVLISVGSKHAVMAGDLMNYVRYATNDSSPEEYLKNNFVYCGYEDALASAISKRLNINDNVPLNIDFVKMSHHGYWYSNTLDYMYKLRPKYSVTTRNGNNENVSDLSRKLANRLEITATQDGKSTSTLLYPYGVGASYNPPTDSEDENGKPAFLHWYSIDDASSMVVRMDDNGVSVYPESYTTISVKEGPSKKDFFVGENIDSSGLVLNAVFDWNTGGIVTTTGVVESGYTITPSSFSDIGTKNVTVKFGDATTTYSVNVYDEAKIGSCLNLTYNGSSQTLISDGTGVSYSGNLGVDANDYVIKATPINGYKFKDGSAVKNITCSIKQTTPNIELSKTSGNVYVDGTLEFNVSLNNDVTYSVSSSNNDVATVTKEGNKVIVKGVGNGTANISVKTATTNNYKSVTKVYKVTVSSVELSSISIDKRPTKVNYYVGDTLNVTGLKVMATYNNGSSSEISGYDYTPKVLNNSGTTAITVTYEGKTATFDVNVKKIELDSISINTMPSKTAYFVGDNLDISGLSLKLKYNNGSEKVINTGFDINIDKLTSAGTQSVTVTYSGKKTTFDVTVKDVIISGISINTVPNKTDYFVGDTLDITGLKVTATYNNGSTSEISDYDYTPKVLNNSGTTTITVTYKGKTATFDVNVKEAKVTSISVKNKPNKLNYYEGDTLDVTGLKVIATYNNGSTSEISGYDYTPKVLNNSGITTITVTYEGKTATFDVNVKKIELDSISINTMPSKTVYFVGDSLNAAGLSLKLKYNNGSEKITNTGFDIDIDKLISAGTQSVTITYSGKKTTFDVTVKDVIISGISINTMPSKTAYFVGDTLDITGLKVIATYNNGSTSEISDYDYTPKVLNNSGITTITVTYEGKTATFDVNVKEVKVTSISVKNKPNKLNYYEGDTLDVTGLTLTAHYNNGTTKVITSSYDYTPKILNESGTTTVTVIYEGCSDIFTVNVGKLELVGIVLNTTKVKNDYYEGDTLDVTGLEVTASYSNNSKKILTDGFEYSPKILNKTGNQEIEVLYGSQRASYQVNVKKVELESINIKRKPDKLEYYEGDSISLTGLVVEKVYNNGFKDILDEGYVCDTTELSSSGKKNVTISYNGKKASFEVNVLAVKAVSISIKNMPTLVNYYEGDKFDSSGLIISLNYNNGKIEMLDGGFTTSIKDGTVLDNAGSIDVVVSFKEFTTSYGIKVENVVVDNAIIKSLPNKINYVVGDRFDSTGLVITVIMNNKSKVDVSEAFNLSISDGTILETAGTKTISVNYEGKILTFDVYIKGVKSIKVKNNVYNDNVSVGDTFNSKNIILYVEYTDGTFEEIDSGFTTSIDDGSTFDKAGKQMLKIEYGGTTTDLQIEVLEKNIENPNTGIDVIIDLLLVIVVAFVGTMFYRNKKISGDN